MIEKIRESIKDIEFKLCKDEKNEIFISIISGYIYCIMY